MKYGIADSVRHHNERAKSVRSLLDWGGKHNWVRPPHGTADAHVFVQSNALWKSMSTRYTADNTASFDEVDATYGMLQLEREMLGNPTTWISPEIMDLLCHGADLMDAEPIRPDDLIAPKGLILFGRPIKFDDYKYVTGSIGWCGLGWKVTDVTNMDGTQSKGVTFLLYSDGKLIADEIPRITGVNEEMTEMGNKLLEEVGSHPEDLYMMDFHAWSFTQKWTDIAEDETDEYKYASPDVAYVRRFFLSLMRFCWQEILVRKPVGPEFPRFERRAVEREAAKGKWDGQVTTLRLRRERRAGHEDGAGTGTGLDHQIFVRGYWRRQWYKELGDQSDPEARRMTFVSPHIKGPDHAPLVIKHQVTAVVR